jgi:hypothetical protein
MKFTDVIALARPGTGKTRHQLIGQYTQALKETTNELERSYIVARIEKLKADQARNQAAFNRDIAAGRFN